MKMTFVERDQVMFYHKLIRNCNVLGRVPPSGSKIEMLNIGKCYPNLLEKVDRSIALYWVVFPLVDQIEMQNIGTCHPNLLTNKMIEIGTWYPKSHSLTIGSCSPKLIKIVLPQLIRKSCIRHTH